MRAQVLADLEQANATLRAQVQEHEEEVMALIDQNEEDAKDVKKQLDEMRQRVNKVTAPVWQG